MWVMTREGKGKGILDLCGRPVMLHGVRIVGLAAVKSAVSSPHLVASGLLTARSRLLELPGPLAYCTPHRSSFEPCPLLCLASSISGPVVWLGVCERNTGSLLHFSGRKVAFLFASLHWMAGD